MCFKFFIRNQAKVIVVKFLSFFYKFWYKSFLGVSYWSDDKEESYPNFSEAVVRRCSVKKGILKNFAKLIGKHLYQGLFLNKVAGLRPVTLLKKRL